MGTAYVKARKYAGPSFIRGPGFVTLARSWSRAGSVRQPCYAYCRPAGSMDDREMMPLAEEGYSMRRNLVSAFSILALGSLVFLPTDALGAAEQPISPRMMCAALAAPDAQLGAPG